MFEIYNLVSIIQNDRPLLEKTQQRVNSLDLDISKHFKDTFTCQGGNTGNGLRHGEHIYHDRRVVDAFTRAGYTLESDDEDENGWAPLNKVRPPNTLSVDLD